MTYSAAAQFLSHATNSGRLGSGHPEGNDPSIFATLFYSFPWRMMIIQAIWSAFVTTWVYYDNLTSSASTFSRLYWRTEFSLSNSVLFSVGWGLFVLLAFFLRESTKSYVSSRNSFVEIRTRLCQLIRLFRLEFPEGFWHPGDLDRIAAHLVAFPIVLKMMLRDERDPSHRSQLEPILCDEDINDILSEKFMYMHCTRVVRAYLSCNNDPRARKHSSSDPSKLPGAGARFMLSRDIDDLNALAARNMQISEFPPALGYVNHLRVFMYIWFFFLPLNIIGTGGWYVISLS